MVLHVSDLDGTLLNSRQEISEKSVNIINELIDSKKIFFTVATARSITSAWPIINKLKLKHPIVFNNGVFIYDPLSGKYLRQHFISEDAAGLIGKINSRGSSPIIFASNSDGDRVFYKGIHNSGEKDYIQRRLDMNDKRFHKSESFDDIKGYNLISIIVIDEKDRIFSLYESVKNEFDLNFHITEDIYSKYYWLEMTDINASKKNGVLFVKSLMKAKRVICYGDNLNDLSMFEIADEKYVPCNANEILKKEATEIIGSNDEDGVAVFLKNRHT